MAASDSQVVITLNLVGQRETVAGLGDAAAAMADFRDAAVGANEEVSASTVTLAAETTAAYTAIEAAATASGARVDAANLEVADTAEAMAERTAAAADTVVASYERMARTGAAAATENRATASSVSGIAMSMRTLITVGVAAESVRAFSNYQTALTKLGTIAGYSQTQIAGLNREILRTAASVGTSPTALANALYSPASERYSPQASMAIATQAARLSAMTGAPIAGADSTSYAIATLLRNQGITATPAAAASMAATIRGALSAGDMQLPQLLAAEGTGIFNAGKTYGIPMNDTLGALAYFSSQGVSPQSTGTRLGMTESLMTGQSAQAAKYGRAIGLTTSVSGESAVSQQLASLGLTSTTMANVIDQQGGLAKAFQMVNHAMAGLPRDQQIALWSKLFGGGRTDRTAMTMAQGAQSGALQDFTGAVGSASTVSSSNAAWNTYTHTTAFEMKQLGSEFSTLGVMVGKDLTPALGILVTILKPLLAVASSPVGAASIAGLLGLEGGMQLTRLLGATRVGGLARSGIGSLFGGAEGGLHAFMARILGLTASTETLTVAQDAAAGAADRQAAAASARGAISGAGKGALAGEAGGIGVGGATAVGGVAAVGAGIAALTAWGLKTGLDQGRNLSDAYMRASGIGGAGLSNTGALAGNRSLTDNFGAIAGLSGAPRFASGGMVTNHPTAIVGEGNSRWPEYVIPTDPTYRGRARGLFTQLAPRLMASGGTIGGGANIGDILSQGADNGLWSAERLYNQSIAQMLVHTQVAMLNAAGALGGGSGGGGGGGVGSLGGVGGSGGSVSSNQALGRAMAAAMGWSGQEWTALQNLWNRESSWSNTARNPSSGAYGIAQALGHGPSNQYPAGAANPPPYGSSDPRAQIQWGLGYIQQRYGDPMSAWAHETSAGWYKSGGIIGQQPNVTPLLFDAGGILPEGINLVSNQTGAPEPLARVGGAGGGQSINLTATVVIDGKAVGQAVYRDIQRKVARS